MSEINIGTGSGWRDAMGVGQVKATTKPEQMTLDPETHQPNTPQEELRTIPINVKGQDHPVFISPKQLADIKEQLKSDPNAYPDITSLPGTKLIRQH